MPRLIFSLAVLSIFTLLGFHAAMAQMNSTTKETTITTSTMKTAPAPAAVASGTVMLNAQLVDASAKAMKKSATVQVKVAGTDLVDPYATDGKPKAGQAHLHYKLDNGPIIATTAVKLSFHGLTPGKHTITVAVAGNDHNPISPETTLTVDIP